jgi:hypothetical protein
MLASLAFGLLQKTMKLKKQATPQKQFTLKKQAKFEEVPITRGP